MMTGHGDTGSDRPLTYDDAESAYRGSLTAARERYDELTDRRVSALVAANLRDCGQFDPEDPGHRALAEREPLTTAEHPPRVPGE